MPTSLLFDCDEFVALELFQRMNWMPTKYDRAIGVLNNNKELIGTILFHNWNGPNVEISYYAPRTLTVGVVRTLAKFVIATFNPARVTVVTSKKNKHFICSLNKFGFKLEGSQRCWYGHRDCNRNTGVRLVMFRDRLNQLAGIKSIAPKTNSC